MAGQYARATAWRHTIRLLALLGVLAAVPFLVALDVGIHSLLLIPVELFAITLTCIAARRVEPVVDRWLRGAVGEERVGEIAEKLHDDGWLAIHDVATGRGNVDHILVGPAGVFTIETKSHRGPISPRSIDESMLKQAYAQSKFVERATGLKTQPLLVFSDAYLVGRGVTQRSGVTVLPARMLAGHLSRRPTTIPADRITATHASLVAALDAHQAK